MFGATTEKIAYVTGREEQVSVAGGSAAAGADRPTAESSKQFSGEQ